MKLRLILVVLIILPLFVKGQDVQDVIFYSKGKMYVKYKDTGTPADKGESASTTLYVDGSAKFATGSSIKQKGRTEITGDFVNAKDPNRIDEDIPQLFVDKDPSVEDDGVIAFITTPAMNGGASTRQRIYGTNEDGTWTGTGWDRTLQKKLNWIDFPTISVEKGGPVDDGSGKYTEDWRKTGYLMVDTTAALSVDYIRAEGMNRFAVDASYADNAGTNKPRINSGFARVKGVHSSMDANDIARYSQVNLKLYDYNGPNDIGADVDDGAFINSSVPDRPEADPNTFGKTLRTAGGHPQGGGWNYLTGFAPPFERLGADYMFYHTLTRPNGGSITSFEGPVVDPFFRMKAGRGYFISMEASHADHTTGPDNINGRWDFFNSQDVQGHNAKGISDQRRARGGYVFNRSVFQDYLSVPVAQIPDGVERMDNFSRFLYDNTGNIFNPATKLPTSDSYYVYGETDRPLMGLGVAKWIEKGKDRSRYELMDQEKFKIDSVIVDLEPGLNFLGNPFMAPISLNPLLGINANPTSIVNGVSTYDYLTGVSDTDIPGGFESDLFSVDPANKVTISSDNSAADIRAKYWLINQALVKYDPTDNLYHYKTTYDYISYAAGSSAISDVGYGVQPDRSDVASAIINPLEYVISPMQMFCLQASKSVKIKIDPSLQVFGVTRFQKSAPSAKASSGSYDIMHNWFVVEADSENGMMSDRTTVIFNDKAKPYYADDSYDTRKGISKQFETYVDVYNGQATKTSVEKSKAIIYTKSSDQESLLGNAVPTKTKELALFLDAPATTQGMKLRFYGLDNVDAVPGVWLVDRVLNKTIKVTPETEYNFSAEGSPDASMDNTNRFVLRFYDAEGDIVNGDNQEISCYYKSSAVHITGLIEDDMNSDVVIYDLQGRLMGRTKINETPSMAYPKPLSLGTYIVKITGKRNYTTKFVNLQD